MTHDEFVGQVQALARLGSRGDAERIIRATLETLAERLDGGFADNLAAQLPSEIGHHLRVDSMFQRLTIDEFFDRVQRRAEEGGHRIDRPATHFQARAVMEVLETAITQGLLEKLRAQLPAEFEPLLNLGSETHGRAGAGSESTARTEEARKS